MAGQRRHQSRGDPHGRRRRASLAAVILVAAGAFACPFESPLDPLVVGRGGGSSGGGTGGGGATGSAALVGSWRNISATTTAVTDTRWTFTAAGACSRTTIITLLDVGRESTMTRACSYTTSGNRVSIVFAGSTFVSSFSFSFANGALLLDGFRFTRFG